MPTQRYRTTMIEVVDTDPVFLAKTVGRLDELWAMQLGQQMMQEIQKKVIIAPVLPGHGNMCTSGGDSIFYRLRAAFRGSGSVSLRAELGHSLMGAAAAGWTLAKIGTTLAGGLSPVTMRTIGNLKQTDTITTAGRERVGAQIAALIEDVADGTRSQSVLTHSAPAQHSLADHLIRFLRPWLRPGTGAGSRINFDPDRELSCMGDKMQKRPPTIGLAHELCHAWRNAVGERLFDDALSCNLPDDEVMTTGFPPYQYERYSENLFRAHWTAKKLPMRVNYR
jgi:hypothetical protein